MRSALSLAALCTLVCVCPRLGDAEVWSDAPATWRRALRALGPTYTPRTQHINADQTPKYINRLILETSPYLRQHAHNPVEWYPWSDEAFEHARSTQRPILLSIGYSTCHWCHVMERESFEDEEIAAYINAHYIAIKVDREERPDIDDVYMKAVQMLTGRGGWPMTTLLTPDKVPFFGGTYFPPRDGSRGRRRGFLSILKEYHQRYRDQPQELIESAQNLSRRIARSTRRRGDKAVPQSRAVVRAARRLAERFDKRWGGFGRAPKFPTPPQLQLLLRYAHRVGDERALYLVTYTLEQMARGGIYDQVGGGFHRYATDQRWRVPHFEKMLYDNAQLIVIYLDAAALTSDAELSARLKRTARETLDYLEREMLSPEGLFYSATDADSLAPGAAHPEEGLFFTWTPQEVRQVLSPADTQLAMITFGITQRGELDGRNILYLPQPLERVAIRFKRSLPELQRDLTRVKQTLYKERLKRSPPLRDDKRVTSWNGLMLSALVSGAARLGDAKYLNVAQRAGAALLHHLKHPQGGLYRTYMTGRARHLGVLDDYAFVIQGLLDIFEADGNPRWLREALALQAHLDQHFWSQTLGGYYMTSAQSEALISRDQPNYDGAEPSGNSIATLNLLRLHILTGQERFYQRAERQLRAFASRLNYGAGISTMSVALADYHDRARELAIVTPHEGSQDDALIRVVDQGYWPNMAIVKRTESATSMTARPQATPRRPKITSASYPLSPIIPWVAEKRALDQRTTAYLCYEGVCEQPTTDPAQLRKLLSQREPLLDDQSPAPLPTP